MRIYTRFYCFSRLLTIHRRGFHIFVSKRFRTGASDGTERRVWGFANYTYPVIYYIVKV